MLKRYLLTFSGAHLVSKLSQFGTRWGRWHKHNLHRFKIHTLGYIDHVLWYFDNWDWKNFYSQTSCVVSNEDINQRNWLYQWNSNGEITDATESQLHKTSTNILIQRGLWKKVNTYTMARILWQDCVFFIVDLTRNRFLVSEREIFHSMLTSQFTKKPDFWWITRAVRTLFQRNARLSTGILEE